MKTLMLCIETEDTVDMSKIAKAVSKVFTTIPGVKGVSIADQHDTDLSREKRLNDYFNQVEYNINCMQDKIYKLRKEL